MTPILKFNTDIFCAAFPSCSSEASDSDHQKYVTISVCLQSKFLCAIITQGSLQQMLLCLLLWSDRHDLHLRKPSGSVWFITVYLQMLLHRWLVEMLLPTSRCFCNFLVQWFCKFMLSSSKRLTCLIEFMWSLVSSIFLSF